MPRTSRVGDITVTGRLGIAAARCGVVQLVAGEATVNTAAITASAAVFLATQEPGGTPSFLRVHTRTVGQSFVIRSGNAADSSRVAWLILEPGAGT